MFHGWCDSVSWFDRCVSNWRAIHLKIDTVPTHTKEKPKQTQVTKSSNETREDLLFHFDKSLEIIPFVSGSINWDFIQSHPTDNDRLWIRWGWFSLQISHTAPKSHSLSFSTRKCLLVFASTMKSKTEKNLSWKQHSIYVSFAFESKCYSTNAGIVEFERNRLPVENPHRRKNQNKRLFFSLLFCSLLFISNIPLPQTLSRRNTELTIKHIHKAQRL